MFKLLLYVTPQMVVPGVARFHHFLRDPADTDQILPQRSRVLYSHCPVHQPPVLRRRGSRLPLQRLLPDRRERGAGRDTPSGEHARAVAQGRGQREILWLSQETRQTRLRVHKGGDGRNSAMSNDDFPVNAE